MKNSLNDSEDACEGEKILLFHIFPYQWRLYCAAKGKEWLIAVLLNFQVEKKKTRMTMEGVTTETRKKGKEKHGRFLYTNQYFNNSQKKRE